MADLYDDLVPYPGTEYQSEVINGDQAAHPQLGHRQRRQAQAQIGVEQPRPNQQQYRCQIQRKKSTYCLYHLGPGYSEQKLKNARATHARADTSLRQLIQQGPGITDLKLPALFHIQLSDNAIENGRESRRERGRKDE